MPEELKPSEFWFILRMTSVGDLEDSLRFITEETEKYKAEKKDIPDYLTAFDLDTKYLLELIKDARAVLGLIS